MLHASSGGFSETCGSVKSFEELAREVARVRGEDSETSDENGPLLVPKSGRVVPGRRHRRVRMLVDHLKCRDGR